MQKFLFEPAHADDRCHGGGKPVVPIEFAGLAAD
jgi:hypothetical protein